ncbi:MAG: hypothetical protein HYT40_03355 [Candidatus Sungbacteria bacterium]|uniref:Uncharacterized protein n=1 Tax=Candidatus Sungiibacteriota bacterium TaxID=2750080 RepID=A0A931SD33_9BACT|nr:hypothetical protein [Candidatus Sungbacteria bacterium]
MSSLVQRTAKVAPPVHLLPGEITAPLSDGKVEVRVSKPDGTTFDLVLEEVQLEGGPELYSEKSQVSVQFATEGGDALFARCRRDRLGKVADTLPGQIGIRFIDEEGRRAVTLRPQQIRGKPACGDEVVVFCDHNGRPYYAQKLL